ncbi:MAG TPA: PQQ-binding-like beta-propeller repeat protein [Acidimicrobiia bacterium]|nr:PQQ-binding-like beta-propeller repeat protein [Acidimicrobiia bacterium]
MNERAGQVIMVVAAGFILGLAVYLVTRDDDPASAPSSEVGASPTSTASAGTESPPAPTTTSAALSTTTTMAPQERDPGTVPAFTIGRPWGTTPGVTMFRGNPTRTYHGAGPVPDTPTVAWRYPDEQMCSPSSEGGVTRIWCGMGWTGQPALWERPDGITELIFGAYDSAVHFVDAATGEDLRPEFQTGDIIKGSVTLDPDGYPLLYFGSRDNQLRILALDRDEPTVLWSMDAGEVDGIWNDDWDSNPVIVDDIMYEGGENGWFFAVQLNRAYDAEGKVVVDPVKLVQMPGYDEALLSNSGRNVSIESSVLVFDQRVYFSNSGGRVVGLDVSDVRNGNAPIVFDYYAGGDIDATMTADAEGMLYVSIEHEPSQMGAGELERNLAVGQLVKLNPDSAGDPRVWGLDLTSGSSDAGSWSSPAVREGVVYLNTHQGSLIAVDAADGTLLWEDAVGFHSWSSPAIVDETLVTATCLGDVRAYSLADPRAPARLWSLSLGESCLEATPVVWKGSIYLGSRDGFMRALR